MQAFETAVCATTTAAATTTRRFPRAAGSGGAFPASACADARTATASAASVTLQRRASSAADPHAADVVHVESQHAFDPSAVCDWASSHAGAAATSAWWHDGSTADGLSTTTTTAAAAAAAARASCGPERAHEGHTATRRGRPSRSTSVTCTRLASPLVAGTVRRGWFAAARWHASDAWWCESTTASATTRDTGHVDPAADALETNAVAAAAAAAAAAAGVLSLCASRLCAVRDWCASRIQHPVHAAASCASATAAKTTAGRRPSPLATLAF